VGLPTRELTRHRTPIRAGAPERYAPEER